MKKDEERRREMQFQSERENYHFSQKEEQPSVSALNYDDAICGVAA